MQLLIEKYEDIVETRKTIRCDRRGVVVRMRGSNLRRPSVRSAISLVSTLVEVRKWFLLSPRPKIQIRSPLSCSGRLHQRTPERKKKRREKLGEKCYALLLHTTKKYKKRNLSLSRHIFRQQPTQSAGPAPASVRHDAEISPFQLHSTPNSPFSALAVHAHLPLHLMRSLTAISLFHQTLPPQPLVSSHRALIKSSRIVRMA